MSSGKEQALEFLTGKTGKSKCYCSDFCKIFPDKKQREVEKVLSSRPSEQHHLKTVLGAAGDFSSAGRTVLPTSQHLIQHWLKLVKRTIFIGLSIAAIV